MILSRFRPKKNVKPPEPRSAPHQPRIPELDDFLQKRDYTGAISFLEYNLKGSNTQQQLLDNMLWLGHCLFRAGEYMKAIEVYRTMLKDEECSPDVNVYLGCCYFYCGMYEDAKNSAERGDKSSLQTRLLFHVAHKLGDEKQLMIHHQQLGDVLEDQLSLASIHYMRQHYVEAIEIYKDILTKHTNMIALNVYAAMCYYKLEYFDAASQMLSVYLKAFPDSPAAQNLHLSILFKTYAENQVTAAEIDKLSRKSLYPAVKSLVRNNMVVFKDGDGALQALPGIIDEVPEARLNLILYHLKLGDIESAMAVSTDLEPVRPLEFLVKALVFTHWGQRAESRDHLKTAEQFFKLIGEASIESDTIAGRQSMGACLFLQGKYQDAVIYYDSIKKYLEDDDSFSFNFGQCLLMCEQYNEAENMFLAVQGKERDSSLYKLLIARTFIRNHKPSFAWDLYSRTTDSKVAFGLLRIIANDCFKKLPCMLLPFKRAFCLIEVGSERTRVIALGTVQVARIKAVSVHYGEYYYAAKAFENLEKIDPSPEYYNGKMSSISGLFKQFIARKATNDQMAEIVGFLEKGGQPQADNLATVIKEWAFQHGQNLDHFVPYD